MSRAQHKFLRGVVYPAVLQHFTTLVDAEDLHEYFLGECFGWRTVDILGMKRRKPLRRSSDLDTGEMTDLIDFTVARCKERGIDIPITETA